MTADELVSMVGTDGLCDGTQEEFDQKIEDRLLILCFGKHSNYFSTLGIPIPTLIRILNEDFEEPTCDNCSTDQFVQVVAVHDKAMEMLDCAIDMMENYDGVSPSFVRTCLETHFGGSHHVVTNNFVRHALRMVKAELHNQVYTVSQPEPGTLCESAIAWAVPGIAPLSPAGSVPNSSEARRRKRGQSRARATTGRLRRAKGRRGARR